MGINGDAHTHNNATELSKRRCKHLIDNFLRTKKEREMTEKEPETYGMEDMMRIFGKSRQTVYRLVREARAGRGGVFLPIELGGKNNLRWSADAVRAFLQNANSTPQKNATLEIESAAKLAARNRAAMKQLEKFGIKITQK